MLEGCPNFHKNIDDKIDKKYSIKSTRHSFYFSGGMKIHLIYLINLIKFGLI